MPSPIASARGLLRVKVTKPLCEHMSSALHQLATVERTLLDVSKVPIPEVTSLTITSSTRTSSDSGIVSPSAFAVLLLMESST